MASELLYRSSTQVADGQGKRTNIMAPILKVTDVLLLALLSGVWLNAPTWLLTGLFVLVTLTLLATLGAYGFFAYRDPESLRSGRQADR